MRLVIIGASFAGLACAVEAHQLYPDAEIILVDQEEQPGYWPNACNRRLKGEFQSLEEARIDLLEVVAASPVDQRFGHRLVALAEERQVVTLSAGGQLLDLTYDYLVLAMGAGQSLRLADESAREHLLTFKTLAASQSSWDRLQKAQSVIVIGAGQLGLECLDALQTLPVSCRLFEVADQPLAKHFDGEMLAGLLAGLDGNGVTCHFREGVNRIRLAESGQGFVVETLNGSYQADEVILATNFEPNSQMLADQLDLHLDGSVVVDAYLRTSRPNVFAVGDLISLPQAYFGVAYQPLIRHALWTGRLAAFNLLAPQMFLTSSQGLITSHLFGQQLTSLGLTEDQAGLWEEVVTVTVSSKDERGQCKLLARASDLRLLGIQIVGVSCSAALLDQLVLVLTQGMTVPVILGQLLLGQSDQIAEELLRAGLRQLIFQKEVAGEA